jgi:hypothetical protein
MTNAAGSRERGFDSIGMCSPSIRLSYGEPNAIGNGIDYAKLRTRSHRAVIHVYDAADNVIKTHEHKGRFPRMVRILSTCGVRVSTATLYNRLNERDCRCLSAAYLIYRAVANRSRNGSSRRRCTPLLRLLEWQEY